MWLDCHIYNGCNAFKKVSMLKRVMLLSFFAGVISNLWAQNIPNGGFEQWWTYPFTIYETPKNWTDNDLLYKRFDPGYKGLTVLKTTRSHSGKYALQMSIDFDHGDTVNGGIYSTGNMDSLMQLLQH